MRRLLVIRKDTNRVIWEDDEISGETLNKAGDLITYKDLLIDRTETSYTGDRIIWVKPKEER